MAANIKILRAIHNSNQQTAVSVFNVISAGNSQKFEIHVKNVKILKAIIPKYHNSASEIFFSLKIPCPAPLLRKSNGRALVKIIHLISFLLHLPFSVGQMLRGIQQNRSNLNFQIITDEC